MNTHLGTRLVQQVGSSLILLLLLLGTSACYETKQPVREAPQGRIPSPSSPVANIRLQPFFDRVDNPVTVAFPAGKKVDITPAPPQLTAFDQSVLQTCGRIGSTVRAESFKQLMTKHPDVLRRLKQVAGGQLGGDRRTDAQFLEDLTAIWFNRGGFEHIFCGELEGSQKIGGLHFVGRYLQLQNEGIGGRLSNNNRREEVIPGVIYTLGVAIARGDRVVTDEIKGYPYVSNAEEILLATTKAFVAQGSATGACLYSVQDSETGSSYQALFVKDRNSIVTFYPDATPKGRTCRN